MKDWNNWPQCELSEMDSAAVLQQYIQTLIAKDNWNIDLILTCPDDYDEAVWQYEHLR